MLDGYKTYIGIIITLLPTICGVFGYHLMPGASDQIQSLLTDLVVLAGGAFALYGRAVAVKPGFLVKNTPAI